MTEQSPAEAIFFAALEKGTDEERVVYLNAACGDDDNLRRRVERLLAAHPQVGSFMEPSASAVSADTASCQSSIEAAGSIIAGRYKLLECIGEGGMGTVFMAQQTEPVKRLVALKVIKPGMDSRQVLARFEAERQALALMDHPNIAKVLDGGITDQGRPFFVMELVKGVPITRYCDERKLTPRKRLELFTSVCLAIQHAHQKGVIHRDIKPSNVLVAQYDGRPVPKVIDFGVAKATGQALTEKTLVTAFGAVIGTLEYMSPEQAELNQLDIDTRCDVYSLGVLLYELLTGTTPIERNRLGKAAVLELLRVVREDEPPRPSTRLSTSKALPSIAANRGIEPKALAGLLRNELDWIVMKALEKDRNRRYSSPTAFVDDIERYLRQDVVQARPPSFGYRFRKLALRHRVAVLTSLAFVLMLTTLLTASIWQAVVATRAERIAIQLKDDAEKAREAESEARKNAELRAFVTTLEKLTGQGTHLEVDNLFSQTGFESREAFLRFAYLLREAPEHAPAWRDHLVMTLILAGRSIAPPMSLSDRPGFDVEKAEICASGRLIATATTDGTVQIREYPSLASRCVFNPFTGVSQAALENDFSLDLGFLDQDRVVWTCASDQIQFWDSTSGRALGPALSGYDPVWRQSASGVVTRGGGMFANFIDIKLWNPKTGERMELSPAPGSLHDVAFSPDGSVLVGLDHQTLMVWSAADGRILSEVDVASLSDGLIGERRLTFSPSGRFLVMTHEKTVAWFDTRDWRQDPVVCETGKDREKFLYPVWADGSDEMVCLRRDPSPSYLELVPEGVGVRKGAAGLLGYAPIAVRDDCVLTENGDLRELGSGRRIIPQRGRKYAEEALRFAVDDRWLRTPYGLIDLAADCPLMESPGIRYVGDEVVGWASAAKYRSHAMGPNERHYRFWFLPEHPEAFATEDLIAWAELLARGELGPDDRLIQLDEIQWERRRLQLASRASTKRFRLPGLNPDDRLFWLRSECDYFLAKNSLLDRLVKEEPTFKNYVRRSWGRSLHGDHLGCLSDELAAVRLGGPLAWHFLLRNLALEHQARPPSELAVAVGLHRPRSDYELVIAWSDSWIESGRSANLARGLALYRLNRFEAAMEQLIKVEGPTDKRPTAAILVRAMTRKRLGEDAAARSDYETVKQAVSEWDGEECYEIPLRDEAKTLFEPQIQQILETKSWPDKSQSD
jgi:serine/threonine protein kinase